MVILYPTAIQPLFNKLSLLPLGELRSRTEALAGKLEFLLKHLTVTRTFSVYHGCVRPMFCRESAENACEQSKHIVIFDTLIKERKPA